MVCFGTLKVARGNFWSVRERLMNKCLGVGLGCLLALEVSAASVGYNATVTKVMVDTSAFGGCGAAVTPAPQSKLAGCGATWVTFDCNGDAGTSKTTASNLLAQSQLAYLTSATVRVVITDDTIINGKCLATQLQVK